MPLGRLAVRIESKAALIFKDNVAVALAPFASVAFTVKVDTPYALGTPEIMPDRESSESPEGRAPDAILHLYGGTPPETERIKV